jgi:hypothetical protein
LVMTCGRVPCSPTTSGQYTGVDGSQPAVAVAAAFAAVVIVAVTAVAVTAPPAHKTTMTTRAVRIRSPVASGPHPGVGTASIRSCPFPSA